MLTIRHGVATDTGNVRAQNEDAFFASSTLFAVADGMGGHNAGEVASSLTTQLLGALPQGAVSTPEAFVEVVQQINQSIYEAATATTEQRGMGTTLTALTVVANDDGAEPPHMVLANVGDSRAYLLRDGQLRQLSVDHSYVQELVTEGLLTADEARTHPRRNIVTRALGIDIAVSVDSSVIPIIAGDRFMLCSDGLVDEVPPSEIESLCLLQANPGDAANALVAAAKKHGGRDNITVIVIDALSPAAMSSETTNNDASISAARPNRSRSAILIGAVVLVVLALFAMFIVGARNARSGYFVDFNGTANSAEITVYQGSANGFLWFGPTVAFVTDISRSDMLSALEREIDRQHQFDSLKEAKSYLEQIEEVVGGNG
jgi:protein phosphatase